MKQNWGFQLVFSIDKIFLNEEEKRFLMKGKNKQLRDFVHCCCSYRIVTSNEDRSKRKQVKSGTSAYNLLIFPYFRNSRRGFKSGKKRLKFVIFSHFIEFVQILELKMKYWHFPLYEIFGASKVSWNFDRFSGKFLGLNIKHYLKLSLCAIFMGVGHQLKTWLLSHISQTSLKNPQKWRKRTGNCHFAIFLTFSSKFWDRKGNNTISSFFCTKYAWSRTFAKNLTIFSIFPKLISRRSKMNAKDWKLSFLGISAFSSKIL